MPNCSVCNKIIDYRPYDKKNVMYRCGDTHVCSIRCSKKRLNRILSVDPNLDTPETPSIPKTEGDPDCPGATSLRIGTVGPSEKEKVVGHELQKTPQGTLICVELYEDINMVEEYLPSAAVATTTATIAVVATSSALLAKPLADLLLKVFKPAIKQAMAKINKLLGKTPYKPTQSELQTNEYRIKKGLTALKFGKKGADIKKQK